MVWTHCNLIVPLLILSILQKHGSVSKHHFNDKRFNDAKRDLDLDLDSHDLQCRHMKALIAPGEGDVQSELQYQCSALNRSSIGKSTNALRCSPRPRLVKLKLPGPNFDIHPRMAEVNRCDGFCHSKSCLPTKTSIKAVPVFIVDRTKGKTFEDQCVTIHVEEHVACQCGCTVQQHHCNRHQKYNPSTCTCTCANSLDRKECELSMREGVPHFWDFSTCSCQCIQHHKKACQSGMVWASDLCRCTRTSIDEDEDEPNSIPNFGNEI